MSSDSPIEEADALTMTLLSDLAALDDMEPKASARRTRARECLEAIGRLKQLGGGSLGEDKLAALEKALIPEVRR